MPFSIAAFDAAYEKRMCWPSPGTRRPKWMSASTAMPASLQQALAELLGIGGADACGTPR